MDQKKNNSHLIWRRNKLQEDSHADKAFKKYLNEHSQFLGINRMKVLSVCVIITI